MTWFQQQRLLNEIATHVAHGDHEQVVRCAEQALRKRPNDTTIMSVLAESLDHLHQNDSAARIRENIIEVDPEHGESLFLLGEHYERTDPGRACHFYKAFLNSKASVYELGESDFSFIRFVAGLFGAVRPEKIENAAREAERRLDRESLTRRKHAEKYLSNHAKNRADA
jgi:hypothetical protein